MPDPETISMMSISPWSGSQLSSCGIKPGRARALGTPRSGRRSRAAPPKCRVERRRPRRLAPRKYRAGRDARPPTCRRSDSKERTVAHDGISAAHAASRHAPRKMQLAAQSALLLVCADYGRHLVVSSAAPANSSLQDRTSRASQNEEGDAAAAVSATTTIVSRADLELAREFRLQSRTTDAFRRFASFSSASSRRPPRRAPGAATLRAPPARAGRVRACDDAVDDGDAGGGGRRPLGAGDEDEAPGDAGAG